MSLSAVEAPVIGRTNLASRWQVLLFSQVTTFEKGIHVPFGIARRLRAIQRSPRRGTGEFIAARRSAQANRALDRLL